MGRRSRMLPDTLPVPDVTQLNYKLELVLI